VAKQKFGLGRGLDALISGASEVMAAQQSSRVDEENILQIPIDALIPNPRQPRRILTEDDPKLLELSASIKQYGLLQPLVVTRLDTDSALTVASQKARFFLHLLRLRRSYDSRLLLANVAGEPLAWQV
jgi:ParB family chromosome partitioning protein